MIEQKRISERIGNAEVRAIEQTDAKILTLQTPQATVHSSLVADA